MWLLTHAPWVYSMSCVAFSQSAACSASLSAAIRRSKAPWEALDGVCPGPVPFDTLPAGKREWLWVEGVLTGKKSLGIWLGWPQPLHPLPGHRESAFGLPRCGGAPSTPGRLGYWAATLLKGPPSWITSGRRPSSGPSPARMWLSTPATWGHSRI